jgi:hypothetical protein
LLAKYAITKDVCTHDTVDCAIKNLEDSLSLVVRVHVIELVVVVVEAKIDIGVHIPEGLNDVLVLAPYFVVLPGLVDDTGNRRREAKRSLGYPPPN